MQKRNLTGAVLAVMVGMSGMAQANGVEPEAAENEEEMACAGAEFMDLAGQPEAAAEAIPDPKRIIPPGAPVTMDLQVMRSNVDLDEEGIITRIWCG